MKNLMYALKKMPVFMGYSLLIGLLAVICIAFTIYAAFDML